MHNYQRTIKSKVSCFGIGLHTGDKVNITLHPADTDTGITFKRTDVKANDAIVKACYKNVSNTTLGTTLSNNAGAKVATIEHLMAAFWGCGIDNCLVEIDGPEVPIMDGSSEPFVFLIECGGVQEQNKARKVVKILKEIVVKEDTQNAGYAMVTPADDFAVSLEINYGDNVITKQKALFDSRDVSFKNDLCRARTFGFAHEVDSLRERGLAKGGSLDNAIVVSDEGILNKGGLRYRNEFARHKILDCIGDVYLAGAQLQGHFHGFKSGHGLNNRLLHELFSDNEAWEVVETPDASIGRNFPVVSDRGASEQLSAA